MSQSVLHLHKLSFTYTGDVIPIEYKSIPFKFFLTLRILFASFRLENLIMTLFGPILGNRRKSSMLKDSISTFSFLNNLRAVSSSSESFIDSGRSLSSKHSHLEYWLQHCRSNETICSLSFKLTVFSQNFALSQIFLFQWPYPKHTNH